MQKRITKTISIYPETQEALNKLTKATGMGESELIREMISKLASDRVGLTILISNFLNREGEHLTRERLLRIMSNRKTLKKDDPAQRRPSTVSSNSHLNDSINNYYRATQEEIEIAKTPWVDNYEEGTQNETITDEELKALLADD